LTESASRRISEPATRRLGDGFTTEDTEDTEGAKRLGDFRSASVPVRYVREIVIAASLLGVVATWRAAA